MQKIDRKASAGTGEGRDERGRFGPGNPGRRPGSRNRTTRAAEALLQGEAESLTRTAIRAALGGDMTALSLCLNRLLPPVRERALKLPKEAAGDLGQALGAVMQQAVSGDLTLTEAQAAMQLIARRHGLQDMADLAARLEALEERKGNDHD